MDPAVALAGWVLKTRVLAAAALMAIWLEITLVAPLALNARVILVATLWDKLLKVAIPLAAVILVVPCKAPLPALRAAVTMLLLSALPLMALRRLPNWS